MKIRNIDFGEKPLFLAPMEDVTDIGFRMLCKRFGAAMVYTEFVSAVANDLWAFRYMVVM